MIKSNIDLGAYNHIVGAAVWCMNGNMYDVSVYSNHETCIEIIVLGIAISQEYASDCEIIVSTEEGG